jgi:hypothetical protein
MYNKNNPIETSKASIWVGEHGIVHMGKWQNAPINIDDARDIYRARLKLSTPEKAQLLLVDLRSAPKPDREARDFAKSEEVVSITRAMAMVTGNLMSQILGNFFLGFNKGVFPVKLFSNEKKAIEWLLEMK